MKVEIHLKLQAKPIVMENVKNTYQKGDLYCVMLDGAKIVHKFPLRDLFRVIEDNS